MVTQVNANNTAIAKLSSVRVSPRKLNLVASLIRGMKADGALVQLTFLKKRIALEVKACLQSAIANAENNFNLNVDELYINRILVGQGTVMKRTMPRARGRAARILKPFSNLTIEVQERKE